MNDIYKIQKCDLCGAEIRERYLGYGTIDANSFEKRSAVLIMCTPANVRNTWTLCSFCADAVENTLQDMRRTPLERNVI